MVKINYGENLEISFIETTTFINPDFSPIKELFNRENLEDVTISFNDEKTFSFDELFTLKVNVNKVGSFLFLFDGSTFNKGQIIEQVKPLKELSSTTPEEMKLKVSTLIDIVQYNHTLLGVYKALGDSPLKLDDLLVMIHDDFPLLVAKVEIKK